jgi:hypothetical protein
MHLTRNIKVYISGFSSDLKQQHKTEINERIKKGNAVYYKNRKLLTSKLLTRSIKLKLYLTLIRPIVTYGAETLAATENELQKLLTFERKIYGPVKDQDNWRIRKNSESDTLTGGVNIVRFIKARRLRWFGHKG